MEVISKFRIFFLIRKNFIFFIIFTFFAFLLVLSIIEGESQIISAMVITIGITLIFQVINLRSVNQITILENSIIRTHFLTGEKKQIKFSQIKKIEQRRLLGLFARFRRKELFEHVIILNNNSELLINPNYFSNYLDLIDALYNNFEKFKPSAITTSHNSCL